MEHPGEVKELIRLLKADPPTVRWQAAARLAEAARHGHSGALAALADALGDEHAFVRWHAGLALARADVEAARLSLYRVLAEGTPLGQAAAADALGHMRKPDPAPLLRVLESPHPSVRQSALEALIRLRARRLVGRLVTLLSDTSPGVRRAAAGALAVMGDDHAIGPLIERLKDDSPLVRCSAAYALGARRARSAEPALLSRVTDPDPAVRRYVGWALGRLRARMALPHLQQLRTDPALDGQVAHEADQAIVAIVCGGWRRLGCLFRRRPNAGEALVRPRDE
jgi:HEAT repeat protein